MGIKRIFRKIFSRRATKRKPVKKPPRPVTIVTTSTWSITQTFSMPWATTEVYDNITSGEITNVPTSGKSSLDGNEDMSLTTTMYAVAGAVGLIVVMTILCFIYRTRLRTSVRMRKTPPGERRSAAISLDLVELNEYDRQIRQSNGLAAFSSPMYGHPNDTKTQAIPIKKPPSKATASVDGDTVDQGYYSVVLHDITEPDNNTAKPDNGDINANDYHIPMSKQNRERSKSHSAEMTPLLKSTFKEEDEPDEYEEAFKEVESIDLSSPPTPHSTHSYVNVPDTINNTQSDYVNTDVRKESLTDKKPDRTGQKSVSYPCLNKQKVEEDADQIYCNSDRSLSTTQDEPGHDYLPMSPSQDRHLEYTPMHSMNEENAENQDNVYIYMDSNKSSSEYVNWSDVDSVYQNS